jgi:flagellar motility protein MotE (MotC chaperone)
MKTRLARERKTPAGAATRAAGAIAVLSTLGLLSTTTAYAAPAAASKEQQQACANIAASAETLRLERRRQELAQLESEVNGKLQALEKRQSELRAIVDRLDAFERSAGESLNGLYTRMKAEVAAAQLIELEDDVAAALLLQLKGKVSAAILNEMPPARGAELVRKIANLRKSSAERKP